MSFAVAEIRGLGDRRRDLRGTQMLTRMIERIGAKTRCLSASRAEEVAFSRFLGNRHFCAADLRASLREATLERCRGRRHVLVIQDTSEINLQHHAGRVRGLGPVGNGRDCGLFVHALLALDADSGDCLGLLEAMPWVRVPQTGDYRKLPIEDKESRRWLDGQAVAGLLAVDCVTAVSDRESDCFELFARRPHPACHLLVRACRDRGVVGGRLFAAMAALPQSFGYRVAVPAKNGQPARTARLVVRFGPLTLKRPQRSREPVDRLPVFAVDIAETGAEAVPNKQRIHWRLITTHAVTTAAEAAKMIDWYRQRWHVEQLFRVLKSQGLDIEAGQSEDAHALEKLVVMASHAAARVLQLVQARDGAGDLAAGEVFEPDELALMAALLPGLEGKTAPQKNPHPQAQLAWCSWIVARLGGWKGYRNSEGPPGPITIRRGYERFCALRDGYRLAQKNVCKP